MSAHASVVPLPSPGTIRADVQRMVDFGPRLPGYDGHDRFCTWLAGEFGAAGLELPPCDEYRYDCWQPEAFGLEILDGDTAGQIDVATTYVRSAGTPPDGVTGQLVFVLDAAFDVLAGNYSPHVGRPEPTPALVVDRDTGRALRAQAETRPTACLTLVAPVRETRIRSVTALLPGESDELIVVNSHSDGQNGFEENGAVALVSLARHFASLPAAERLRRTIVFAAWPGHMSGVDGIEDASCWIAAHPDLCERAVAAVTMEHLGAGEWVETEGGFHATGENELYAVWTTQGPMKHLAQPALVDADLQRHALMKPPIQITPGRPFHEFGIPHVSGIAGPTYLLVVSENGEMDKFDEQLASRQIAFYADVVRRIDGASATDLRTGDPTLGANPPTYRDRSRPVDCRPA
jgi:hypothetical protein